MIQKFTKKELERLNCSDEEIALVMKYQRKLPFANNDFEMSARSLHDNLEVGRDFSGWITGRIKKYIFWNIKIMKSVMNQATPNWETLILLHFQNKNYQLWE